MTELLVIDVVAVSTPGVALAVRCHEGTLRVGDRVQTAIDPGGAPRSVSAECSAVRLSTSLAGDQLEASYDASVAVDQLEATYDGFATFMGVEIHQVRDG
jgi:hypothetical protein